jgi:hypothetical protein
MHVKQCYDEPIVEAACACFVIAEAMFLLEDIQNMPLYARFGAVLYFEVKHMRPHELRACMLRMRFLLLQLQNAQDLSMFQVDKLPDDLSQLPMQLQVLYMCPTFRGSPVLHVTKLDVEEVANIAGLRNCMLSLRSLVFDMHNPIGQWLYLLHLMFVYVYLNERDPIPAVLDDAIMHMHKFPMLLPEVRRKGTLEKLFGLMKIVGDSEQRMSAHRWLAGSEVRRTRPMLAHDFTETVICNVYDWLLSPPTALCWPPLTMAQTAPTFTKRLPELRMGLMGEESIASWSRSIVCSTNERTDSSSSCVPATGSRGEVPDSYSSTSDVSYSPSPSLGDDIFGGQWPNQLQNYLEDSCFEDHELEQFALAMLGDTSQF